MSLFVSWQDFVYHGIAAFFYLSASVALAKVTLDMKDGSNFQNYQLDISAVVRQQQQQQLVKQVWSAADQNQNF